MANLQPVISWAENAGVTCLCGEPLSSYTTFRIGGPAAVLVKPATGQQIAEMLHMCTTGDIPYCIIGNGSNLLVSDTGFDGVVILLGSDYAGITLVDDTTIRCQAGALLSTVCNFALKHSLSGLEFAWGIPGSIGGAAYMNAGAYGGEMKDVIISCTHLNPFGEVGELSGDALDFSYRHSAYSESEYCISEVTLSLSKGDPLEIRAKMQELLGRRKAKQPLEYPSAGSTFRRPKGNYAAALIEQCGLKGVSVGGAMVSPKHSGFIVNTGNATCADVQALILKVQQTVERETGYHLECEVKMI